MVRSASFRSSRSASPRLAVKRRDARIWIFAKNTSTGGSGVSRRSSVIAASCQSMTVRIVSGRSMPKHSSGLHRRDWDQPLGQSQVT